MHSFHPSRGRILFEVLCALGSQHPAVAHGMQTGASALLAAAAVAALYGLVHLFDLLPRRSVLAVEPQRIEFTSEGKPTCRRSEMPLCQSRRSRNWLTHWLSNPRLTDFGDSAGRSRLRPLAAQGGWKLRRQRRLAREAAATGRLAKEGKGRQRPSKLRTRKRARPSNPIGEQVTSHRTSRRCSSRIRSYRMPRQGVRPPGTDLRRYLPRRQRRSTLRAWPSRCTTFPTLETPRS